MRHPSATASGVAAIDTAALSVLGENVKRWQAAVDGWTDWLIAAGRAAGTIECRRNQLRIVAGAHLHRNPWKVTQRDLVSWLARQAWAANTRRSYRAALSSFYGWGRCTGHTRHDPTEGLPAVKAHPPLPRPTPDHVLQVALLTVSDRDRLILSLAAYAGLRRAEIARLRWDDIEGALLRVVGKGNKERTIPINPKLAAELTAERLRRDAGGCGSGYRYTAHLDGPWLFPGRDGGHLTPAAIGRAASLALGPGWAGHTLRHRFGTLVWAGSRDAFVLQTLMGHAKLDTSRGYAKVADKTLTDAVNLL